MWACMLWEQDAIEHARSQDVSMDVVGTGCSETWTKSGCAHGCGLKRMQSSMDVIRMWMWAMVRGPNVGLALNALNA